MSRILNPLVRFVLVLFAVLLTAAPVMADITGTVFRDFDADGAQSGLENGLGGIEVRAFGAAGLVAGPVTSAPDGSYTLSALPAGPLRLEFTFPTSGSHDAFEPGPAGSTSVVFAADPATVDVGFNVPDDYCDDDPDMVVTCYIFGAHDATGTDAEGAVVRFRRGNGALANNGRNEYLEYIDQLGSVYGLAFQRTTGRVYVGAFAKRHSDWGPGPSGGATLAQRAGSIYVLDNVEVSPTDPLNVLDTFVVPGMTGLARGVDGPALVGGGGNCGSAASDTNFSRDSCYFDGVGKEGLGDLELSDDETRLWTINLEDLHLYMLDVADPSAPGYGSISDLGAIADPGCAGGPGDWRPFALEYHHGELYIGGVCSGETGNTPSRSTAPTPDFVSDAIANVSVRVVRVTDPTASAAATQVFSRTDMTFNRGRNASFGGSEVDGRWHAWVNGYDDNLFYRGDRAEIRLYSQPWLVDIEFDRDGSLILGFRDRTSDQLGVNGLTPGLGTPGDSSANNAVIETWTNGDLNRACWVPSGGGSQTLDGVTGDWVWEGETGCTFPQRNSSTEPDPPSPEGTSEWYFEERLGAGGFAHEETSLGGLAFAPRFADVALSAMDPFNFNTGGMKWLLNSNGDVGTPSGYEVYATTFAPGGTPPATFAKANGIGDAEYICEPAPIEIGNRVWCDAPSGLDTPNGIQDPVGATGVPDTALAGVTVALSCNGGAVTATTVTDASGSYLFNESNVTGGIPPGATCTVSINTVTNAAALGTCNQPTFPDVGMMGDAGQDLRDSDGTNLDMNDTVEASVTIGGPGANDHKIDFGFRTAPPTMPMLTATKADVIQIDGDGDGMLDGGDTLRYTVVITNTGNGDATMVDFTSSVDPNTSLVVGSVMTSQGTVTTGNSPGNTSVAVDIGTLAMSGGTVTITFDVVLDNPVAAGVTEINCQGLVTTPDHPDVPTDDPDDPPGSDPTDTPVTATPVLEATKVDALVVDGDFDGRVDAGDTVRYTVVVANTGDQDATNVAFTSLVDVNTTLTAGTVTTSQGSIPTGNNPGDTSVAVDIGTLAGGGGSATITFDVTVNSPIPPGVTEISCQGTTTGDGGLMDSTDDPDDPDGDDDPTLTPVDLGEDFGDAPDSYTTTASPSHRLNATAGIYLGACVDAEADGQPSVGADGDDTNLDGAPTATLGTCTGNDDEDGVVFDTMVMACSMAQVTVTSAGLGAVLNAWIDFDHDGVFDHPAEQIFSDQALTGADTLMFPVPCDARSGGTYARFRVNSGDPLTPTGAAFDGEVEDYTVLTKGADFGDAPDSYGTLFAAGAYHSVDPTTPLYLGACVDTESNGQPVLSGTPANGDDTGAGLSELGTCATANDDEDGVSFDTMIIACGSADVTVTASMAGRLAAWLDFGGDGAFDAGDQIFTDQALAAGANNLSFSVPCDALTQDVTYARFRVSTGGSLSSGGAAADGEVEDYEVSTKGLDLGDAPDSYGTQDPATAASHVIDPASTLYLGACVDTEMAGQPVVSGTPADGDDNGAGLSDLGGCASNDDEDGVTFDSMVVACGMTDVTITTSAAGVLNAWLDFGGDGAFDAGDQIFTDQAVNSGANSLQFSVPCDAATQSVTYARFRLASAGGLGATGQAMDGEVEDYEVTTKGADLGDAPDTYGTTFGSGGPYHAVDPGTPLYLGACVDTEADGQPVAGGSPADGDDTGAGLSDLGGCASADDEDGITFDSMIVACSMADLTITASSAGMVDAWLDFGGDGVFDAGDQILTAQPVVAGANSVQFSVPCTTPTQSVTYARFRLSTVGGLSAGGPAMNGEVEDYDVVTKGVDLGDAPDSFGTTLGSGGPSHAVDPGSGLYLGACVDTEADGQPVLDGQPADGDDTGAGLSDLGGCASADDEDGVVFDDMIVACGTSNLTVTASAAGLLDAWIDFDGDGAFSGAEQIFTSQAVGAGASSLPYTVPCTALTQAVSYARFRLSSAGGLGAQGPAMDGEVEDYEVVTKGLDLGDAPEADGYPTLISSDGARHVVLPTGNPTLGLEVDTEPDGQPTAGHDGDDNNGVDDEDGVTFGGSFIPGGSPVDVTITTGTTGGLVSAWIDWNADGDWDDAGEQIATDVAIAASDSTVVSVSAPAGVPLGVTCSRVRISTAGGDGPAGLAMDGEIEDYVVVVGDSNPAIGLSKEVVDVQQLSPTDYSVLFSMVVENLGDVPLSNIQIVADLATAFADADGFAVDMVASSDLAVNPAFDGDAVPELLLGTDSLSIGATASLTVQVIVQPGANPGPYICSSTATGDDPNGGDVEDISQNGGNPDPDNDGDGTDDNEPTEIIFPLNPVDIPTVDGRGMLLMVLLLAGAAVLRLRR